MGHCGNSKRKDKECPVAKMPTKHCLAHGPCPTDNEKEKKNGK